MTRPRSARGVAALSHPSATMKRPATQKPKARRSANQSRGSGPIESARLMMAQMAARAAKARMWPDRTDQAVRAKAADEEAQPVARGDETDDHGRHASEIELERNEHGHERVAELENAGAADDGTDSDVLAQHALPRADAARRGLAHELRRGQAGRRACVRDTGR